MGIITNSSINDHKHYHWQIKKVLTYNCEWYLTIYITVFQSIKPHVRTLGEFLWQIFFDKWFNRVHGWANFLWQMFLNTCWRRLLDKRLRRESCKIVQRKEESSSRNKWFFSQKVKESINISYGSAAVLLFRP